MNELTDLEREYLRACAAQARLQQEMAVPLAATLGVRPEEILYGWMEKDFPGVEVPPREWIERNVPGLEEELDRELWQQFGPVRGTEWDYFFHGLECDLCHTGDGRFLRIEFGPRGRLDIAQGYSVLQLVRNTRAPWPTFPRLAAYFATPGPGGDHARMAVLHDRMQELGLLEPSAPDLYYLSRQPASAGPDWIPEPRDLEELREADFLVCHRTVLSARAWEWLEAADGARAGSAPPPEHRESAGGARAEGARADGASVDGESEPGGGVCPPPGAVEAPDRR